MIAIQIGDRFYFNNYCVARGFTLPDYLIVTDITHDGKFVHAQYENHFIDTRPRMFAMENLWFDSNLNEKREDPSWIFLKAKDETMAQGSD